ncbi:E3 ubiquitin-protein ligase rififylin-like, partial [Centroberyx gerrardi]|uniref:E3 ubiquitin-protein ligase rififylin-like n=1 Tax=Centroberyx gerrardi TaxID=166262 RepID=UPI003AAEA348
ISGYSWSCLNPTATVEENGSSWHQAGPNLGFSPSLTCPTHLCKACGGHFDTRARKHVCVDCKKNFCGRCSVQLEPPHPRLCHTCRRFHGTLFNRTQLMRLKVRELRDYLHLHEVPTQTCREKEELVDLVLDQHTPSNSSNDRPISPEFPPVGETTSPDSQPEETNESGLEAQAQDKSPQVSDEGENEEDEEDEEEEEDDNDEEDRESSDSDEGLMPGRRASLSDLSRVEDIEGLSVRQLKEILARNFVNFKGCCEKWELMERVTRLYNDYKDLQNQGEDTAAAKKLDENLCRICMDSPIDCVLLECGHMVTCSRCGKRMNECPICRQYVVRAVHVFRS